MTFKSKSDLICKVHPGIPALTECFQCERERADKAEAALDELRKDVAEWHSIQECAQEVHKLRTALEHVRDEFDFSWDNGDPAPLRRIAIDALGPTQPYPF